MVSIFVLTLGVMAMVSTTYTHPAFGIKSNEDWPEVCKDKYYCWVKSEAYKKISKTFEKLLRDENFYYEMGTETEDRNDAFRRDVGYCQYKEMYTEIYMIRDENNITWYVPQTANYTVRIQIRECNQTDHRIRNGDGLDSHEQMKQKLQCTEQRINFKFPVLYKNEKEKRIELKALSPHKGLPFYCSAKVIK